MDEEDRFKYIQFGDEVWERNDKDHFNNEKCHDCGIDTSKPNVHYGGCDNERCPKCGNQLIICDCWWDYCDEGCGNWEEDGCDSDHSGGLHENPPKGMKINKSVMESYFIDIEKPCKVCKKLTHHVKSGKPTKDNLQGYQCTDCREEWWYKPTKGFAEEDG